ncbi:MULTISPECIES: MarR family winged helix-turn-helix transcriptional regulator [Kordiimonas]|jgi:DNA-binding MarR family transcriptional regulator|uniref:DNA-binding transcriptional regulator, MarR family n=1 Tax=Kordiimonas lacus TaxID=637679 RepID=A0A1G7B310_9PROT|nr:MULTISPECIES: MarR family transcriptional regulator [Kordiimonas]SDE21332.1 DNA-binding transcriptional regulator, MarR family [Kordiimonas lacus]
MKNKNVSAARRRVFRLTDRIDLPLDLLGHMPFRIATVSNLLALTRDMHIREISDLEAREMRVLINIGSYMPINGADIAYQSRMDSYTVSRASKVLRSRGLIDVEPDATNKRTKNFVLTEKGIEVYKAIANAIDMRARAIDAAISTSEKEALFDMLARIENQTEQLLAAQAIKQLEAGNDLPADQRELIRWYKKGRED